MYKRTSIGLFKHLDFMILDIICLCIAFLAAYMLRHGMNNPYLSVEYRSLAIVICFIEVIVLVFFNTLKNVLKRGYYQEFSITLRHVLIVELAIVFYLFSIQESQVYSRLTIYYMGIIYCVLTYSVRLIWKHVLKTRMQKTGNRSLLIVTVDYMVQTTLQEILKNNYEMFRIAGVAIINKDEIGMQYEGIPVVADKDSVIAYACREWVDEVLLNLPDKELYPQELIDQFTEMGIAVHIRLCKLEKTIGRKQFVENVCSYTVLTSTLNYATPLQMCIKRTVDIVGGVIGCIATLVLIIVLGPIIYLKSPGPIFFVQERIGKNGRKFKMYKFRSMYLDAEERKQDLLEKNNIKDGLMFKLNDDPRIIGNVLLSDGTVKRGVGHFIRSWSLDEFPQFFNIIKGDMSIVGTRPPTVDEWEKYDLHHRSRLAIRPGLTGLWQVSGRSDIVDFEEVVRLDREYICGWSMGLDFKIMFQTVKAVLNKSGAR